MESTKQERKKTIEWKVRGPTNENVAPERSASTRAIVYVGDSMPRKNVNEWKHNIELIDFQTK